MTPGSVPWLMRHELRLAWRAGDVKQRWARLLLFILLLSMMSGAGLPFGYLLRGRGADLTPAVILGASVAFAFIAVMSFATSLSFTAASFVDRGDLDLLLSSPVPMRRLLTVRLSATALRSLAVWLMLFGPPVLVVAWMAGPRWLGGLLLLVAAGLIGTAVSTWLAVGLFRTLGARRVRSTATVITALSGLSMGLAPTLFHAHFSGAGRTREMDILLDRVAALPFFTPAGIGSLPARALFGEAGGVLTLSAIALALFLVTTWRLAPSFASIAIQEDPQRRRSAGSAPLRHFGGPLFRQLLLKEYRLLLRNHALMLQILARAVTFVPLLVINLSRHGESFDLPQLAGAATLVLGQTGGATVWAFIAAETQPDLLASSPHPPALFRRSRLAAGLLPSLALVIAAAALMRPHSGLAALSVLAIGTAACLSSAAINSLAKAARGRRGGWGNVPRVSLAAQVTDMASGGAWAAAAWLLASGSIWTPLPAWLGLSVVWLWREFSRRDS